MENNINLIQDYWVQTIWEMREIKIPDLSILLAAILITVAFYMMISQENTTSALSSNINFIKSEKHSQVKGI